MTQKGRLLYLYRRTQSLQNHTFFGSCLELKTVASLLIFLFSQKRLFTTTLWNLNIFIQTTHYRYQHFNHRTE